jgi:hypothetical protein
MNKFAVLTVALVCSCCVGLAAWMVGSGREFCPPPSSASVARLFAPCQAFDTALGHSVTKNEAERTGLLKPDGELASPAVVTPSASPAELVAQDFRAMAQDHATVGLGTRRDR